MRRVSASRTGREPRWSSPGAPLYPKVAAWFHSVVFHVGGTRAAVRRHRAASASPRGRGPSPPVFQACGSSWWRRELRQAGRLWGCCDRRQSRTSVVNLMTSAPFDPHHVPGNRSVKAAFPVWPPRWTLDHPPAAIRLPAATSAAGYAVLRHSSPGRQVLGVGPGPILQANAGWPLR